MTHLLLPLDRVIIPTDNSGKTNTKYDDEELDILKSHQNNQLKISKTRKTDLLKAVKSAKNTIERTAELNIKLTEKI